MVFDILVLVVLLASAFIAFLRGVIRETLTILGVVGGLAAAYYAGPMLLPHMEKWLGVEEGVKPEKLMGLLPYDMLAQILAYGAIFIVVVIVLSILSHIIAEVARSIGLGPVDRTLGVIFGIARGIVLLGIFYLPFHVLMGQEEKDKLFEGSKTFFYIEQTAEAMTGMLPEATVEKFKDDAETIKEGSQTREKLQGMDLLKKDKGETPPADNPNSPGYTEDFREHMDQLFENKPPPQPGPVPLDEPQDQ